MNWTWVIPAATLAYLFLRGKKEQIQQRMEAISVDVIDIVKKIPPAVKLRIFNPNSIPITTSFINIQIYFKDYKVATLLDSQTRTLKKGNNDITLDLKASFELIPLLFREKSYRKDAEIIVKYIVGTPTGVDITGEKKFPL